MSTIVNFPPGVTPSASFAPGDFFVVCDWHEDILGRLIRAGERVRHGNTDAARWSHSGIIVGTDGSIVEANAPGIQLTNISKYKDADIYVVHVTASDEQRKLAAAQAFGYVGAKYDYLDFVGLGFQALLRTRFSVHTDGAFICSGLVSRCTEKYVVSYPRTPEDMMPSDLAAYWNAETKQPLPKLGLFDKLLNGVAAVGNFIRNIF